MKAFFRAVGPAFHKNLKVGPFETVNVYALMCHILGIWPEVNDGHLNATRHMLVTSGRTPGGVGVDVRQNAFTGLAATAGFLVVVFIVMMSHRILSKQTNRRSESFSHPPEEIKQTAL